MSFIQREIDRIREKLLINPDDPQFYAAMQALEWALEPSGVASPYNMIMGIAASTETREPAQS